MLNQIPDAEEKLASGDVTPISSWLKKNIYDQGRFYTSSEICRQATGRELDTSYFIDYVSVKMEKIHMR
jgi:carboxypeptidase Taq